MSNFSSKEFEYFFIKELFFNIFLQFFNEFLKYFLIFFLSLKIKGGIILVF